MADGLEPQLKIDQRVFMTPSRRRLDLNIVQSNFHIEITPRFASSGELLSLPDRLLSVRLGTTTAP
jgi:replication factor C subunit 3/5